MVEIAARGIDAATLSTREINASIRVRLARGAAEVLVENPNARHNLAVALLQPGRVRFLGSVGYYCGGLIDGPEIDVEGSAGWGLAESMMNGHVVVRGSAGNGAAAAIRGGTVVIHGDAAARLGVSMKGGTGAGGGNCGYMAGFMGQKGTLIVCGDTGRSLCRFDVCDGVLCGRHTSAAWAPTRWWSRSTRKRRHDAGLVCWPNISPRERAQKPGWARFQEGRRREKALEL